MRKKKLGIGKWVVSGLVVAVLGASYWLSLERPAPQVSVETPVELKIQPIQ